MELFMSTQLPILGEKALFQANIMLGVVTRPMVKAKLQFPWVLAGTQNNQQITLYSVNECKLPSILESSTPSVS